MSLLFHGIKSLGDIAHHTGDTIVQAVCATPQAIKNGTLHVVTAITSAINGGLNRAKSAVADVGNKAVHLLTSGKDAVIANCVHDYAELYFRILNVGDTIANDLLTKQPSQVNRNELAERLEEFVELHTLEIEDKDFILGFCKDLANT